MTDSSVRDYRIETLKLDDGAVATLVSLPAQRDVPNRGAILYIHGFVDYFFHDHVAEYFTRLGWNWYALDLRRNGRSLQPNDEPWYTNDLTEYYEEIDASIARIQTDGHSTIVMMGHSTGGLVASLWAHDRRENLPISALVLNSPWLDLQEPWIIRKVLTWAIRGLGVLKPLMNVPRGELGNIYTRSIHRSHEGEWEFNPRWKPLTPQPVKMGFLGNVRSQQARLHRELDVPVPILMLRSDKSLLGLTEWDEGAKYADTVLDVEQMHQWLPSIGRDVTEVPLTGALHDVMLSESSVRQRALDTMSSWLDERL